MKNIMKIAALLTAGLVLVGCSTDRSYSGPERGIDLKVETLWGIDTSVRSLTYKFKTEKPLGTLTVGPNGTLDMTGPAVEIWARMQFCEAAPNAEECT